LDARRVAAILGVALVVRGRVAGTLTSREKEKTTKVSESSIGQGTVLVSRVAPLSARELWRIRYRKQREYHWSQILSEIRHEKKGSSNMATIQLESVMEASSVVAPITSEVRTLLAQVAPRMVEAQSGVVTLEIGTDLLPIPEYDKALESEHQLYRKAVSQWVRALFPADFPFSGKWMTNLAEADDDPILTVRKGSTPTHYRFGFKVRYDDDEDDGTTE